jgi:hypothetical protein
MQQMGFTAPVVAMIVDKPGRAKLQGEEISGDLVSHILLCKIALV